MLCQNMARLISTGINLEKSFLAEIKDIAKKEGKKQSDVLRVLLKLGLEKWKENK